MTPTHPQVALSLDRVYVAKVLGGGDHPGHLGADGEPAGGAAGAKVQLHHLVRPHVVLPDELALAEAAVGEDGGAKGPGEN